MAKKAKRRSVSQSSAVLQPTSETVVTAARRGSGGAEFNPDYSYVKKDLKRIGILAGSFIGILVILTFFLR